MCSLKFIRTWVEIWNPINFFLFYIKIFACDFRYKLCGIKINQNFRWKNWNIQYNIPDNKLCHGFRREWGSKISDKFIELLNQEKYAGQDQRMTHIQLQFWEGSVLTREPSRTDSSHATKDKTLVTDLSSHWFAVFPMRIQDEYLTSFRNRPSAGGKWLEWAGFRGGTGSSRVIRTPAMLSARCFSLIVG